MRSSQAHLRGREPVVLDHLAAEPGGDLGGVALDGEVEVGSPAAEQHVADGAPDQVKP